MKHKFQCEYCGEICDTIPEIEKHELTHKRYDEESFGKRLAKARIDKGLSQTKLAKLSGIDQGNIWNYENNKTTPKVTTLRLICLALEISSIELLGF